MCGFSKCLGYCSAHVAELWGVYQGLMLAKSKDYNQLIVEIDSKQIVSNIHNKEKGRSNCWSLMNKIQQELNNSSCQVQFVHCFKEANKVAHALAYIGNTQVQDVAFYDILPDVIASIVYSDCRGSVYPRAVAS